MSEKKWPLRSNQVPLQKQSQKILQKFQFSGQQEQALKILSLPILDLNSYLLEEISRNPILDYEESHPFDEDVQFVKEIDDDLFKSVYESENLPKVHRDLEENSLMEKTLHSKSTLYEYLLKQVGETFSDEKSWSVAKTIVGYINAQGFLEESLDQISFSLELSVEEKTNILNTVKTFKPEGIGSKDMQELLLFRLKKQRQERSLAYKIIQNCFDDLIHQRYSKITKRLSVSYDEIKDSFYLLRPLLTSPGSLFSEKTAEILRADATVVVLDEKKIVLEVHDEVSSLIRLNGKYIEMLYDQEVLEKTKKYLHQKLEEAKLLYQNFEKRNHTLKRVLEIIIREQKDFFLKKQRFLNGLTMSFVAKELEVHVSTVSRTVDHKVIHCSHGLLFLKEFFSLAAKDQSQDCTMKLIAAIIESEDKTSPFKDEEIVELLVPSGIICTRRTISKYRSKMGLGNSLQRKMRIRS